MRFPKYLSIVALITLLAVVLSACGGTTNNQSEESPQAPETQAAFYQVEDEHYEGSGISEIPPVAPSPISTPVETVDTHVPTLGNDSTVFDGLEIAVSPNFVIGRDSRIGDHYSTEWLYLFLDVTNVGENPNTLNSSHVSIFNPSGMQVTPITGRYTNNVFTDTRGNMLPNSSQEMLILIQFDGTGEYVIHFSDGISNVSISATFSRNGAMHSRGLVGHWWLFDHHSSGFYASAEIQEITFHEDGTGYMLRDDYYFADFNWNINLNPNGGPANRLEVILEGRRAWSAIYSIIEIYNGSLYLFNTRDMNYTTVHDGPDVFWNIGSWDDDWDDDWVCGPGYDWDPDNWDDWND